MGDLEGLEQHYKQGHIPTRKDCPVCQPSFWTSSATPSQRRGTGICSSWITGFKGKPTAC
eukprot:12881324-Prorocentrum_lima.AAC.1